VERDMPENLQFDDEGSRLVEEFNASPGATERRRRIIEALALKAGETVLDVGSGPGHQAYEMSAIVGADGRVEGFDPAESAIAISSQRCIDLPNVHFHLGGLPTLPFDADTFDAVMSSQVFEYLDDVQSGLCEIHRILRPGGRLLIHDTDWGSTLWHSTDPARMARILEVWVGHLVNPHLPQTLGKELQRAGFSDVSVDPIVQLETDLRPGSASNILMKFVVGYVESQGVKLSESSAWMGDLVELDKRGEYFYSSNEYMFVGQKRT